MFDVGRDIFSVEVDAQLMHHVESSYAPTMRVDRYLVQPVLLGRPPNNLYSGTVTLTCAACGDDVEFQVCSVIATRLRWTAWVLLTLAGVAAIVWGTVLAVQAGGSDETGAGWIVAGIFTVAIFGMLWVTEFGVGGWGTRFTTSPHGLRLLSRSRTAEDPAATG